MPIQHLRSGHLALLPNIRTSIRSSELRLLSLVWSRGHDQHNAQESAAGMTRTDAGSGAQGISQDRISRRHCNLAGHACLFLGLVAEARALYRFLEFCSGHRDLAWVTLLPAYFMTIFYRARKPNGPLRLPVGSRVAMVVTKAPSEPFSIVATNIGSHACPGLSPRHVACG